MRWRAWCREASCAVWVSQIISREETRSDRAVMERRQSLLTGLR